MHDGRPGRLSRWYRALRFGAATSNRVRLDTGAGLDNKHVFSVALWINPTTLTDSRYLWGKGTASQKTLYLGNNAAGGVRLIVDHGANTNGDAQTSGAELLTNKWQFVAGTYTSGFVGNVYLGDLLGNFYRPAQSQTTGTVAAGSDSSGAHTIGNSGAASPTASFQGAIAFFAHWTRALSVGELARLCLQGIIPFNGLDILMNLGEDGAGRSVMNYSQGNAAAFKGTITGATAVGSGLILPRRFTPYGLPESRRLGFVAATATTYTAPTPTGGLQSGGAGPLAMIAAVKGAGGLQSGGIGARKMIASIKGAGGASFAGIATIKSVPSIKGSGGLQSGGAAARAMIASVKGAGGVAAAGHAPTIMVAVLRAAGGLQSGGAGLTAFFKLYVYAPAGGATFSGAATLKMIASIAGSGGLTASGSAIRAAIASIRGSGGLQSGGAAALKRIASMVGSGGIAAAGAAPYRFIAVIRGSGGLLGLGGGIYSFQPATGPHIYTWIGAGGLQSGGVATIVRIAIPKALGGLLAAGAAPIKLVIVFKATGGAQLGGTGLSAAVRSWRGSGGLQSGGVAYSSLVRSWRGSGGLQSGGGAKWRRSLSIVGSGGLLGAGSARLLRIAYYHPAGGVQAGGSGAPVFLLAAADAYSCLLRVYAALDGRLTIAPVMEASTIDSYPALDGILDVR